MLSFRTSRKKISNKRWLSRLYGSLRNCVLKLLVDQPLAADTATILRIMGHDAVNASDLQLSQAHDETLIETARHQARTIATLDTDFNQIVATGSLLFPSIILLRVHAPAAELAADLIHLAYTRYPEDLGRGCFITCTRRSMRMRSLPIRRVK